MNKRLTIATLALAAAAAAPAGAQTINQPPLPAKGIWLEGTYTEFAEGTVELPSSIWYLGGRFPLSSRLTASFDLPLSHAKVEALGESESSTVTGNPFVGVEYAAAQRIGLELGARLPLTSADEDSFGDVLAFAADPLRAEAFAMDAVPVYVAANYTHPLTSTFSLRGRGGITTVFLTDAEEGEDGTESALDYGVSGNYDGGNTRFTVGLSGRWFNSEEGDFAETSLHQLGASADFLVGGVRPGVQLRLPLDEDFRDIVDAGFGVYLQVPLR